MIRNKHDRGAVLERTSARVLTGEDLERVTGGLADPDRQFIPGVTAEPGTGGSADGVGTSPS